MVLPVANESCTRVVIIAAGLCGLCMAIRLQQAKLDSLTIPKKADRPDQRSVGGKGRRTQREPRPQLDHFHDRVPNGGYIVAALRSHFTGHL
jgi:thioredoxin reductase